MTHERVAIAPSASSSEENRAILARARARGFGRFVVSSDLSVDARPGEEILVREGEVVALPGASLRIPVVSVGEPADLENALRDRPLGSALAIEWTGDRMIPLENAIAHAGRRFDLWVFAREPRETPGALGALEHGARRVIVAVRTPGEVDELELLLEGTVSFALDWTLVEVRSVRPSGVGDRVLVDTTSLLDPSEGLLVGSAAGFLFHVASEAVGSQFSRPRPFRVNAGAAHSYVLLADGSTRYLSELEPGDAVLVCRPNGTTRPGRVGRVKIERRPLVVVTAAVDGVDRTIFLQEAETVRLSAEATRVATTEIVAGTQVHGVRLAPARHLGRAVEETIIER